MGARFLLLSCLSICFTAQIPACEPECVKKDSKDFILTAGTYLYPVSSGAASKSTKLKNLMADGKNQLDVPMPQSIMPLMTFCMEQFHDCSNLHGKALLDQVHERAIAFLKPILKQYDKKTLQELHGQYQDDADPAFKKLTKQYPFRLRLTLLAAADFLQHRLLYQLATRQVAEAFNAAYKHINNQKYHQHRAPLTATINGSFASADIAHWLYLVGENGLGCIQADPGFSVRELLEYKKLKIYPRPGYYSANAFRLAERAHDPHGRINDLDGLNTITIDHNRLDLSHHKLSKLSSLDPLPENLESLYAYHNFLENVELQRFSHLKKVGLGGNRQLRTLLLPETVTELDLSACAHETIDLRSLSKLLHLNLNENQLTQCLLPLSLQSFSACENKASIAFDLSRLTNLQVLKLDSNIKEFPIRSFPPNLRTLFLKLCALTHIDADDRWPLTLQSLDLTANALSTIDLSRLTRLEELSLLGNQLKQLHPATLPKTLKILNLACNAQLPVENQREISKALKFADISFEK